MVNHIQTNLVTSLKAVNDDGVLRVPLQGKGGISSLELTCRATNGAGGSASYGLLASITKVEIKTLHGQGILDLSATEVYRIATLKRREAPQLSEGTGAGAVQIVKLPIDFGIRGSELYGLDLEKYPDCYLNVYYTLHINAGDGFATKTFELDVDATQTQDLQQPFYQGRIGLAEAWNGTTQVQNPHRVELKGTQNVTGIYLYAYKSGTADNALVKNINLIAVPGHQKIISASFSDLQERRKPVGGSIVTSWLALWVAPGMFGERAIEPLKAPEVEIELEELVADGAAKIFLEELRQA